MNSPGSLISTTTRGALFSNLNSTEDREAFFEMRKFNLICQSAL